MDVEGIKQAGLTACNSAITGTKTASVWLGKQVRFIGSKSAEFAGKTWEVLLVGLTHIQKFSSLLWDFSKTNSIKGFYAFRTFMELHKTEALYLGIGAASTALVLGALKMLNSEDS